MYRYLFLLTYQLNQPFSLAINTQKQNEIRNFTPDVQIYDGDKVGIKLFYESLCGDCKEFDTTDFSHVVRDLHEFLKIYTNPYGNSQTYVDNHGKYTFKCQHGEKECYGNKLHACALNIIQNQTEALLYNSCMMNDTHRPGSDDHAADKCGKLMNLNSEAIKTCAKGDQGSDLLKRYGDESKDVHYEYVPFVLINGKEFKQDVDFTKAVCAAFKTPPPPCKSIENKNGKRFIYTTINFD